MAKQNHAPQQNQLAQGHSPLAVWGGLWKRGVRVGVENRFSGTGLAGNGGSITERDQQAETLVLQRMKPVAPAQVEVPPLLPALGLERRLVRRAETMWKALRRGEPLPRLSDATALLQPPFAGRAALITRDDAGLRLSYAGSHLKALGLDDPGLLRMDSPALQPGAQLLAELALEAMDSAMPASMASEDMTDPPASTGHHAVRGRDDGPALLLRAVALPFAGLPGTEGILPGDRAPAAIVIASWREYLSAQDTVELHAELARAIGRPGPFSRC